MRSTRAESKRMQKDAKGKGHTFVPMRLNVFDTQLILNLGQASLVKVCPRKNNMLLTSTINIHSCPYLPLSKHILSMWFTAKLKLKVRSCVVQPLTLLRCKTALATQGIAQSCLTVTWLQTYANFMPRISETRAQLSHLNFTMFDLVSIEFTWFVYDETHMNIVTHIICNYSYVTYVSLRYRYMSYVTSHVTHQKGNPWPLGTLAPWPFRIWASTQLCRTASERKDERMTWIRLGHLLGNQNANNSHKNFVFWHSSFWRCFTVF